MKLYLIAPVMLLTLIGCNSLERLTDGREVEPKEANVIVTVPGLDATAPDFGLPIAPGYTRTVYHGALPLGGVINVTPATDAKVAVFMKQRNIGQWFRLKTVVSGAFYYSYDKQLGVVTYKGTNLSLIEYCIYQDVKI